jgi:hypothetical protein
MIRMIVRVLEAAHGFANRRRLSAAVCGSMAAAPHAVTHEAEHAAADPSGIPD